MASTMEEGLSSSIRCRVNWYTGVKVRRKVLPLSSRQNVPYSIIFANNGCGTRFEVLKMFCLTFLRRNVI
jgi:hypothetical protein